MVLDALRSGTLRGGRVWDAVVGRWAVAGMARSYMAAALFVAERFDRVEGGGAAGGEVTEHDADRGGEGECEQVDRGLEFEADAQQR